MVALDVAAPGDFTDPDQSFLDNLPQPYRLIVSVLETEVGKYMPSPCFAGGVFCLEVFAKHIC